MPNHKTLSTSVLEAQCARSQSVTSPNGYAEAKNIAV